MYSAAGDNEVEGFKGWLFLDYWPFRYLCQGSLLTSLTVLTWSGVSRKTMWLWLSFTNVENQILQFSNSWNHWKFHEILSVRQLNVIRYSGALKTGFGQDAWKVWGLKLLSKQYKSGFAEIRSGKRGSYPKSWTYRPSQVVPHQGQSTHNSTPPFKGTPPYSCFEGDLTDKSRASPPVARWEQAQKHLHRREIFHHRGSSITTRIRRFMLKHPLRCILSVQECHQPSYVMVWWEMFYQGGDTSSFLQERGIGPQGVQTSTPGTINCGLFWRIWLAKYVTTWTVWRDPPGEGACCDSSGQSISRLASRQRAAIWSGSIINKNLKTIANKLIGLKSGCSVSFSF